MRAHVREFRLVAMCRVLGVQRSGYYAWLRQGTSARERDDQRLLGLIRHHWLASGAVYGYRKITLDLREAGEHCSRHRVRRLMKDDRNIYFIDSRGMIGTDHLGTVDGSHPSDQGFMYMTRHLEPQLRKIFRKYGIR